MAKSSARLTDDELHAWRSFLETSEIVASRLSTRMQAESTLSPGDYQVLLALTEAPEHQLRSSELATTIEWERSRLSHHLGRMEKRGLITRGAIEGDSRGAAVVMTSDGRNAFRRTTVPHFRAVRELFVDAFSDRELEQLSNLNEKLRAHLGLNPLR